MIPGPIAINAATYVGYVIGINHGSIGTGILGAIFATIGISLPSYLYVLTTMFFIDKFKENKMLQWFLDGVKPAAVGLIAAAAIMLTEGNLFEEGTPLIALLTNPINYIYPISVVIFIAAAVSVIKFKVNPILATILAGVAGAFLYSIRF
jgi:chromate transporter